MGIQDRMRQAAGMIPTVNFTRSDPRMEAMKYFSGMDPSDISPSVMDLLRKGEWSAAVQEHRSFSQQLTPILAPLRRDAPSPLQGSGGKATPKPEAGKPDNAGKWAGRAKKAAIGGGLAYLLGQAATALKEGKISDEQALQMINQRGEEQVDPVKRINDNFNKQLGRGRNGLR
jgi:hypothetical protein